MARATRSFRLALSAEGMSLLIDAHCHLIRTTRCLLSWGASLHIAVRYLDTLPGDVIATKLEELPRLGLVGTDCHHVGAPAALADFTASIARRIDGPARLGDLYLVALQLAAEAPPPALQAIQKAMADPDIGRTRFRT